jgi:hypothetical protein
MRTGRILALPLVAAALAAAVSTINGDTPTSATQHPTELGFAGDAYVNEGIAPDRVLAFDVEFYVEGLTLGSGTEPAGADVAPANSNLPDPDKRD